MAAPSSDGSLLEQVEEEALRQEDEEWFGVWDQAFIYAGGAQGRSVHQRMGFQNQRRIFIIAKFPRVGGNTTFSDQFQSGD